MRSDAVTGVSARGDPAVAEPAPGPPAWKPAGASRPRRVPRSVPAPAGPAPAPGSFGADMLRALARRPRAISPKYFYDAAGSALFERICALPEYYPTRTEVAILSENACAIARSVGPGADLVEFGAGAAQKVRILLDALESPSRFAPVDICAEHLAGSAAALARDYPCLRVRPVVADFTRPMRLPARIANARRTGFFAGSSLGNFDPRDALALLRSLRALLAGGALLLGVDLVKDPALLHAAYNDAAGVTAAFNRNLLERANRELGADFDPRDFAHHAFYDPRRRRIEMHLVALRRVTVRLLGRRFDFGEGESLHTENSYKFTIDGLRSLARRAGFRPGPVWCDPQRLFSVHWLEASAG